MNTLARGKGSMTKTRRMPRAYYVVGCYATLATSRLEAIERVRRVVPVNMMRLALVTGIPWGAKVRFTDSVPMYQPWLTRRLMIPDRFIVDDKTYDEGEIIGWAWDN